MPIDPTGIVLTGQTNYSLNITTINGVNLFLQFSDYGLDQALCDTDFQAVVDLFQGWDQRDHGVGMTANKFVNRLHNVTPSVPDPVDPVPDPEPETP